MHFQAANRLHQALDQIKATGLELPKVPQFKFVPHSGNKSGDAAAALAGAGAALPTAALAANPGDSTTNVMAQLQSMLMGQPSVASPVVDPNALGSALTALAAFMTPAAAASAAEERSPAALKVRTDATKGTPSRKANDPHSAGKVGNVAAPATPAVGAAAARPFSTPPSRRKRPAESPASGAPKSKESGQRRRVRVVQNAQWPEGSPGKRSSPASGKAAMKLREEEGLAALSAAASQVEDEVCLNCLSFCDHRFPSRTPQCFGVFFL